MEEYTEGSVSAIISQLKYLKSARSSQAKQTCTRMGSKSLNLGRNFKIDCKKECGEENIKRVSTPLSSTAKKKRKRIRESNSHIKNKKRLGVHARDDEEVAENLKKPEAEEHQSVISVENFLEGGSSEVVTEVTKLRKNKMRMGLNTKQDKSGNNKTSINSYGGGRGEEINSNSNIGNYRSDEEFTIFVGNLPLSYDHKKVVKLFSKFGSIKNARIRCVPVPSMSVPKKSCAITKKFHPNRNSVVAFIVFKSKDGVSKAVAENGMVVDGHHLRIDHAVFHKKDFTKSVFVGGLPFDIEDDELWEVFKNCGEIKDVRVIRDEKLSMGKGFGYVNFESAASVELALKLNGHQIKQRKINVQRCLNMKCKKNSHKLHNVNKPIRGSKLSKTKNSMSLLSSTHTLSDFQGRKAQRKEKKKKSKRTKDAIRRSKIKSAFLSASKEVKKCLPHQKT